MQHGDLAVGPAHLFGDRANIGIAALDLNCDALHLLTQAAAFFIDAVDLVAQAVVFGLVGLIFALLITHRIAGAADRIHPQGHFQLFAAGRKLQKAVCLIALFFQRTHTALQFAQDIAQAL